MLMFISYNKCTVLVWDIVLEESVHMLWEISMPPQFFCEPKISLVVAINEVYFKNK